MYTCILQNTQYFQLINLHTSYNIGKNLQNFANQIAYKVAGQRETNNFNEEMNESNFITWGGKTSLPPVLV